MDVAEEPVGRVSGEIGQRPEQLPPPVVQLDGLQQHAGQAENGSQVQHPGDIHAQPGELHPRGRQQPLAAYRSRLPQAEAALPALANAGRRGRSRDPAAAKSRQRLLGGENPGRGARESHRLLA